MSTRIITEVNLVAHLRAKGFQEPNRPQIIRNVVNFTFEETPELIKEIGDYFNHDATADPLALVEALRVLKALVGELRRNEKTGGDR
jgi:hypothetical protein